MSLGFSIIAIPSARVCGRLARESRIVSRDYKEFRTRIQAQPAVLPPSHASHEPVVPSRCANSCRTATRINLAFHVEGERMDGHATSIQAVQMLYQAYQAHADLMVPLRALASLRAPRISPPFAENLGIARTIMAACELIPRAKLTHHRPPCGINAVRVGNREDARRE